MEQFMAHHVTHDVVRCLDDVPVKGQLPPLTAQPAPQPPAEFSAVGPAGGHATGQPSDRKPGGPACCCTPRASAPVASAAALRQCPPLPL
jgi:hypothetical protein